ncbi:hypothetical protein FE236_00455 [Mariprofundus erugo]|uniref:hypothetical protein n=1 Tax=Mariprofundus erugo TaxID=2528639 RepID=UPI0010FD6B17|nr:hypothetical protein [Mariprofundus erugo]TLS78265.1 hypothetical protein FE236_00455 [Mariprofundus erugo]
MAGNEDGFRLETGERLLWSGQPLQGFRLRPRDWFLIPFSALFTAVSAYFLSMILRLELPQFMAIISGLFTAIGVYLLVLRFPVGVWLRRHTRYMLTDRRVVVVRPGLMIRPPVQVRNLSELTEDVRLLEHRDGSGSIIFERESYYRGSGAAPTDTTFAGIKPPVSPPPAFPIPMGKLKEGVQFDFISQARSVYYKVWRARDEALANDSPPAGTKPVRFTHPSDRFERNLFHRMERSE